MFLEYYLQGYLLINWYRLYCLFCRDFFVKMIYFERIGILLIFCFILPSKSSQLICQEGYFQNCFGYCEKIDLVKKQVWICNGKCQPVEEACNGVCPTEELFDNCHGICEADDEYNWRKNSNWTCKGGCQSRYLPCDGDCPYNRQLTKEGQCNFKARFENNFKFYSISVIKHDNMKFSV